jgi:hypothetical protein
MPWSGHHWWKALLSVCVLWGLVVYHPADTGSSHCDRPGHCCDLCHSRHLPPVQAVPAITLPRPVFNEWQIQVNNTPIQGEPPLVSAISRAPPR